MAKWFTSMESIVLPDDSQITVSNYRAGAPFAQWNAYEHSGGRCDIVAHAALDTAADGWRERIEAKADAYPAVLAFVTFLIACRDAVVADSENRNERRVDDTYAWSGGFAENH